MKKNPVKRRIQLSDVMCKVHDEMVDRFNQRMLKCKSEKAVGIDHKTLHDLRDTFIICMWAMTGE